MTQKTQKLFYTDPYVSRAECTVLSADFTDGNTVLTLDATPFFPGGGGQERDSGSIDGCEIINTYEKDGVVYHVLPGTLPVNAGDTVVCIADAQSRFYRMQAHTGEHIFSGIACRDFGVNNVGFHMDGTVMTVDFDKPLTTEQLNQTERKANAAVWQNLPVQSVTVSPEQAGSLEFRSKIEFTGDVRIVTIPGVDSCACCAPHVKSTGEIGLILMLSAVSHRGGVRITLCCGKTAYEIAARRYFQVKAVAGALTVAQDELLEGFEAFVKKTDEIKTEKSRLETRLCLDAIKSIQIKKGFTVTVTDLSAGQLNRAAALIYEKADYPVVLLSGDDKNGYAYIITAKNYPLKDKIKQINASLNGRGGGKNEAVRGVFSATLSDIKKYFEELPL